MRANSAFRAQALWRATGVRSQAMAHRRNRPARLLGCSSPASASWRSRVDTKAVRLSATVRARVMPRQKYSRHPKLSRSLLTQKNPLLLQQPKFRLKEPRRLPSRPLITPPIPAPPKRNSQKPPPVRPPVRMTSRRAPSRRWWTRVPPIPRRMLPKQVLPSRGPRSQPAVPFKRPALR